MKFNKTTLAASVVLALASISATTTASAVAIADGAYTMSITTTPVLIPGTAIYDAGLPGNYNSSLTFNGMPSTMSFGMTDNGVLVSGFGSSIAGDAVAGKLGMSVSSGNISFNSFNVDTILYTAGGDFAQEANAALFRGITTATTTSFDLTGRLGGFSSLSALVGKKWDYATFTTGSSTNGIQTVLGTAVTSAGDVNGDGLTDYAATFVSAGVFGPEWGGFSGLDYVETLKVSINSVPLPAALWLLGSGLLGLVTMAKRKN